MNWYEWASRIPQNIFSRLTRSRRKRSAVAEKTGTDEAAQYAARVEEERRFYDNCLQVADLPAIYSYWSNKYVRPKLEAFGFSHPNELYVQQFAKQCRRDSQVQNRFVSIGSGNCDVEVDLAAALKANGLSNFTLECVDLSNAMLDRGRAAADSQGVSSLMSFTQGDFNAWKPAHRYDAVMVNQALHHVTELEALFSAIKASLNPGGLFVTSDMIGRNGHMRWPEALDIVQEFWAELPPRYHYNHQLKREEPQYINWDCSVVGFEGIRAQDILPLLLKNFHFHLFIAFANIIDIFIDRGFGHNFDPDSESDRGFVDRVHHRDELEIAAGHVKPTHMIAVLSNEPGECLHHPPLSPSFCLRTAVALPKAVILAPGTMFSADPNPVPASSRVTRLSWTTNVREVELHIDAPNGPLFARDGGISSASTGPWVVNDMTFYLQDGTATKPTGQSATLAKLVVPVD
jgi:SAM-dependent methyltransferase